MNYYDLTTAWRLCNYAWRKQIEELCVRYEILYVDRVIVDCLLDNGECSKRELASYLNIAAANITRPIQRLEKSRIIQRQSKKEDSRYAQLKLTEKGERAGIAIREYTNNIWQELLNTYERDRVLEFHGALTKISHQLSLM